MIDLRFHPNSDKNRLGFYTVGSYHTYSKVDAIEVGLAMGRSPQWHFNDAQFDSQDWFKEPKESLWEMYTRRAQQLREKYDYLVLMYSGGADSHNILNAFVRNNIHLDEIVQFSNLEISGDKDNFWNAEVFRVAAPVTAEVIAQYQIKTKHRILDVSKDLTELSTILPDLSHWIYGRSGHLSINTRAFLNIRHSDRDYKEIMHRGKKVGFIWGYDKPPVMDVVSPTNPGKIYRSIMLKDMVDCVFNPLDQINDNDWIHDETFYWSPECPWVLVKQAHVIEKFFATATKSHPWLQSKPALHGSEIYDGQRFYLTSDGINQLIYPYWDPKTFSVGKPSSQIIGERDKWMLRHDSDLRRTMFSMLREIQQRVQHHWRNWHIGMATLYSPVYTVKQVPMDAYPVDWYGNRIDSSYIRTRLVV